MADKKYYIGSGNYFGKCEANNTFYNEMLPLVKKLKIDETDIDKIVNIVSEIYNSAYNDGYDNAEHEVSEYY